MKQSLLLLFASSVILATGCVDVDRMQIRFHIDQNLRGNMTLEFLGIHSSSETVDEQKSEMKEFFETGYLEDAAQLEREWSLLDTHTELSDKTELRCNGKVTGEIRDLIQSLSPLLQERGSTYEIKRDEDRFSFTVRGGWNQNDDTILLFVRYEGRIVEHNAQKYDPATHEMEWNLGKLDESGVHFVLDLSR